LTFTFFNVFIRNKFLTAVTYSFLYMTTLTLTADRKYFCDRSSNSKNIRFQNTCLILCFECRMFIAVCLTSQQIYITTCLTSQQVYITVCLTSQQVYIATCVTSQQVYITVCLTSQQVYCSLFNTINRVLRSSEKDRKITFTIFEKRSKKFSVPKGLMMFLSFIERHY